MTKLHPWLQSSVNPDSVSKTVQGVILGSGVFLIYGGKALGVEIAESEVATIAQALGGAVAALLVAYGLICKVIVWGLNKYNSRQ